MANSEPTTFDPMPPWKTFLGRFSDPLAVSGRRDLHGGVHHRGRSVQAVCALHVRSGELDGRGGMTDCSRLFDGSFHLPNAAAARPARSLIDRPS